MTNLQLSHLLKESAVKFSNVQTKNDALKELAIILEESCAGTVSSDVLYKALYEREEICSTGFGNGISIPHCKINSLKEFSLALLLVKEGVEFNALDQQPVSIFIAIAGPDTERNEHLHLLSKLSRILNSQSIRDEILASENEVILYNTLLKHSPDTLVEKSEESVLLQVTIQKEEFFEPIVEVVAGISNSSISVASAEESSQILRTVPLFKGLEENSVTFGKLIRAVIPKKFTNECIRQIEQETGDLSNQTGILLTVQDLLFCRGKLHY